MAFKGKKTPVNTDKSSDSEIVRRFKTNPFLFIGTVLVLVIVIVAFVLVPAIVPTAGQGADLTFGSYDKIPISYVPGNFFARYYEMLSQYTRNSGDENYNQFADYQLWLESYQAAVRQTAIIQEMKNSGYTAPAKVVDREVAKQYQENGRFSQALYDSEDSNSRLTRWRRTQEDIAVQHFYSDLGGILTPAAAAEFVGKMASRQRTFDMAIFPVENYPDTELAAYGQEQADLFRTIRLSRITVSSSEREAQQILASIKDGTTTFEDAARTHSRDSYAERGGDMGVKAVHELAVEIADEAARNTVIALARGEYSNVIPVDTQWAFFRVEEEVKPADFADTATLGRVRTYVQTFERGRMERWAEDQAREFITLVGENGFTNALAAKNLERRTFGPVPLNYGGIDLFGSLPYETIPELSGSIADENFWKTAFSTPINSPSEPLVQGGNILVLFPTNETEAEQAAQDSIGTSYSSYWLLGTLDRSLTTYFLNSDKMEDRFMESFFRFMMPLEN